MANANIIWNYFQSKGLNEYGIAGLMGNLYAESGLMPNNLQNTGNKKLGITDDAYVKIADTDDKTYSCVYNGKKYYGREAVIYDGYGFGIAQWTFWSRKRDFLSFARAAGKSIGDLDVQLDFLWKELSESYKSVLQTLKTATSVLEASNAVLLEFERPADQSEAVQRKRAGFGQGYYDQFTQTVQKGGSVVMSNSPLVSYTKISPNKTSPRTHEIDTISIHCVVGQCTVETLGEIFAPTSRQASSNYGVGKDGRIGMYVEEKDRSWCTSSASNDHRAITIEVASDTTHPYAVTEAAYEGLIKLLVDICQRNPGIKRLKWGGDKNLIGQVDKQNMTVHRWFANKACPGDYLYNRHGEIAAEVNRRLDALEGTDGDNFMADTKKFEEAWLEYRKTLQDNDAGQYSEEARKWAVNVGLIAGNGTQINGEPNCMWQDLLTREQFVTVLYRFAQMMGKA